MEAGPKQQQQSSQQPQQQQQQQQQQQSQQSAQQQQQNSPGSAGQLQGQAAVGPQGGPTQGGQGQQNAEDALAATENTPVDEGVLLARIHVPELYVSKCLQFPKDQLVWDVKQQCLASLPKVRATLSETGFYLYPEYPEGRSSRNSLWRRGCINARNDDRTILSRAKIYLLAAR